MLKAKPYIRGCIFEFDEWWSVDYQDMIQINMRQLKRQI